MSHFNQITGVTGILLMYEREGSQMFNYYLFNDSSKRTRWVM